MLEEAALASLGLDPRRTRPAGDEVRQINLKPGQAGFRHGETFPRLDVAPLEQVRLLAEDFSIEVWELQAAFVGVPSVPKRQAIEICVWAYCERACSEQR